MINKITDSVIYIGVNDYQLDMFESQYVTSKGIAYNSYLIKDEKLCIMDSVDIRKVDEWLSNIEEGLEGNLPDYLIIQHMEPDHCGSIEALVSKYPNVTIVTNKMGLLMLEQFFPYVKFKNTIVVKEGDFLELGKRKLKFILAPLVHWPEVMMTYDEREKTLYSADAFGKFSTLDVEEEWYIEARRYYFGIIGKYGRPVQMMLKKIASLDIENIYSLHGPILKGNVRKYIELYDTWSSYNPEKKGVMIFYTSIYGHTKQAVELLKEKLGNLTMLKVETFDLARSDIFECVAKAFCYDTIVLATTTYCGEIFPAMNHFIQALKEREYQKRRIGIIENGSWAPNVIKIIKKSFETSKDIFFCKNSVSIKSSLNDQSLQQIEALAIEIAQSYKG